MKLTMKRSEVEPLDQVLDGLKRIRSTRFAYAVAKNRQALKAEVESLQAAREPSDNVKEFDQKRSELVAEYAERDDKGGFIAPSPGQVKLDMNRIAEFNSKIKALAEEFGIVDEMKKKQQEVKELLDGNVEIEMYGIRAETAPADLSSDEMLAIMPLIIGDLEVAFETKK